MEHSEKCKQLTEEYNRRILEWEREWPNYCKNCNGAGQFVSYYDPSPPGVSLGSGYMEDIDPCDMCTINSICPRCGGRSLSGDGNGPCEICNWNYDDCKPPMYECLCYEDEPYCSQLMAEL